MKRLLRSSSSSKYFKTSSVVPFSNDPYSLSIAIAVKSALKSENFSLKFQRFLSLRPCCWNPYFSRSRCARLPSRSNSIHRRSSLEAACAIDQVRIMQLGHCRLWFGLLGRNYWWLLLCELFNGLHSSAGSFFAGIIRKKIFKAGCKRLHAPEQINIGSRKGDCHFFIIVSTISVVTSSFHIQDLLTSTRHSSATLGQFLKFENSRWSARSSPAAVITGVNVNLLCDVDAFRRNTFHVSRLITVELFSVSKYLGTDWNWWRDDAKFHLTWWDSALRKRDQLWDDRNSFNAATCFLLCRKFHN